MKNSLVMRSDFEYIDSVGFIPWDKLRNKTILITGGTGLIGSNLIKAVVFVSKKRNLGIRIAALVRSEEKARKIFEDEADYDGLSFIKGDVTMPMDISGDVDYIIHGASVTSSRSFIEHPVETINTAVDGTRNILEIARKKQVEGVVYLSSMEVYGHPEKGHTVTEDEAAGFDTSSVRNCYPLSKQICESLCSSYAEEYGVNVMTIRLTQTFGPGVDYSDGRVFAEFMRSAIEKRDIVLKTMGETERCYLYTADSVTAILAVLLKGERKGFYNAANPDTYCSIMEMAKLVAEKVANGSIKVSVELADVRKQGYASTLYMMLDVSRLRKLGWEPVTDLEGMYRNMLASVIETEKE
jgi:nucleoside-diphosphate-sugar epimerase